MRLLILVLTASFAAFAAAAPVTEWQPVPNPWPRELGTHRVILKVDDPPADSKAVSARIEWRRPDKEPEKKAVLVYDLKTGKPVANVNVEKVTNEEGVITFEPIGGAGEYAVYFLPVKIEGGAFPVSKYAPPQRTATEAWLKEQATVKEKPQAEVARWEAISKHDAWTEMEVMWANPKPMPDDMKFSTPPVRLADISPMLWQPFARVESSDHAVRVFDTIPQRWYESPKGPVIKTRPGQYLTFQIIASPGILRREGLPAGPDDPKVSSAALRFSDFTGPAGVKIPASAVTCFHLQRVDWQGRTETLESYPIPYGRIQPLWCGVQIPAAAAPGLYDGIANVQFPMRPAIAVPVDIEVSGDPIADHGDADPQSLSRLRWLNSTTAVDDEPVKGYPPLEVKGRTIRCLGRELELGEDGLPVQIRSYFNKAVTKVMDRPTVELLQRHESYNPVRLYTTPPNPPIGQGYTEALHAEITGSGLQFTMQTPGVVEWTAQLAAKGIKGQVSGHMEGDGSVNYRVALEAAEQPKALGSITLNFVRGAGSLDYILGLQQETGALELKEPLNWKWDVANKHQDSLWLGAVNGGLRVQFKADNYARPSVNIHYKRRPLNDPPSWNAGGTGGIVLTPERDGVRGFAASSGPVTLQPGKPLHFDFDLLITPFHTLRTKEQWADRYYHTGGVPQDINKYLDGAKSAGANVVNIHQGNWLNPYINYPFLTWEKLRDFSKAAHDRGMRAKYYYTVRELSNWCPELFAFRSMGDEILMSGKGGGHPWGEEHLGGNYWQAWFEPGTQDVSFLTQPMSRFHNYYIEGLRWLCENAGCDGIYLDDIAYDRSIMLRARKVLDRYCPRGGLIDLHSWNEFHEGGAWAHCANIFMDSMPFVDRLWFGEGHHYTGPPPEHFLVELSGIPFGLMGEMLEGGGNPWFGLVHGMTGRLGWQGDPRAMWKLWDDFGVQDAEFIGWWAGDECPVRCADPLVKATVWKKADATLVAVANFSKDAKPAALTIDWKALGRDPVKAKLYAPPIPSLKQRAAIILPPTGGQDVPTTVLLKPYAGTVFILDEKDHALEAAAPQAALGPVLMDEDFTRGLDNSWTPVLSPHARDSGKLDAGYVLQAPANVHAYLERTIPAEAGAVSTRLWQDGKDEGQQWGPGLALIWSDGKTLRANIRQDGRLSVYGGGTDSLDASITARAPVEFTVRWDKESIKIVAGGPAMGDLPEEIASFPRSQFAGQPSQMRIGKMPNSAGPQDFGEPGAAGFSRIEWVRVFQQTR